MAPSLELWGKISPLPASLYGTRQGIWRVNLEKKMKTSFRAATKNLMPLPNLPLREADYHEE
jgi:hypothetical protein